MKNRTNLEPSQQENTILIGRWMNDTLTNVLFGHFRSGHPITRFLTSPTGSPLKCLNVRPAIQWLNFLESTGKLHPNCVIYQRPVKLEIAYPTSHQNHNDIVCDLATLIHRPDVRFIIILLDIGSGMFIREKSSVEIEIRHVNAVILDRRKRTVERFEPHGHIRFSDSQKRLDKQFLRFLRKLDIDYKYLSSKALSSAQHGPQIVQKHLPMQGGYCTVWSLMYIHARMTSPDQCPQEVFMDLCRGSPLEILMRVASYLNVIDLDLNLKVKDRCVLTPTKQIKLFEQAFDEDSNELHLDRE